MRKLIKEELDTKTINQLAQAQHSGQIVGGLFLLYAIVTGIGTWIYTGSFVIGCFGWYICLVRIVGLFVGKSSW